MMMRLHLSSGWGSDTARALGSGWGDLAVLLVFGGIRSSLESLVLLARAVDGDLDSELAALDLLAVHFGDGLLLRLFSWEGDEGEATSLTRLATRLKLADHEARDRPESELCAGGLIGSEELEELTIS